MPDSQFVTRLSHQFDRKLPGPAAQARFAPQLGYGRHFGPPAPDARQAAVIAVFCDEQDSMFVPLTLRPAHLKDHGGQISLPGGVLEAEETPIQGALRELEEEIGLATQDVQIVGQLSPIYVFASNYWVTPFVGVHHGAAQFSTNDAEVESLIQLPVAEMLSPQNIGFHRREHRGLEYQVPHLDFEGQKIWGATSMILGELIAICREV